jgi:hypothetical protein
MKKQTPQAILDYLKARASEGGKAIKKKYGKKHFAELGKHRRYPPCPIPRPKDASKRHRFNPKTGICYGCGANRKTLK